MEHFKRATWPISIKYVDEFKELAKLLLNKKDELNDAHRLLALWYINVPFSKNNFEALDQAKFCVQVIREL